MAIQDGCVLTSKEISTMTAPSSIASPAAVLHEQLARASPDSLRELPADVHRRTMAEGVGFEPTKSVNS
jgi:hypothetical protein